MVTDSLDTLGRTALTGVLAYLGLVLVLRTSGSGRSPRSTPSTSW